MWSQDRYEEIKSIVDAFLRQEAGFRKDNITFVPISGLTGENLSSKSSDPNLTKWYDGPCLLDILDECQVPKRAANKPLRITVMDYEQRNAGDLIGDCVQARIIAGIVQVKDKVTLMPQNCEVQIKGIE